MTDQTTPRTLLLRILAGPNAGGELPLGDGDYVLGAGEACDVVLADATVAARHVSLRVRGGAVLAQPLDGGLHLAGRPFFGGELPPFAPLAMGATHLALGPADQPWPNILLPLPTELADGGGDESSAGEGTAASAADGEFFVAEQEGTVSLQNADLKAENSNSRVRGKRLFLLSIVGVLLLALILLIFVYVYGPSPTGLALEKERAVAAATALVKDLGFTEVTVQVGNGVVTLDGYVPERADRRKLFAEMRAAGYPVSLRVRDGESMAAGLHESLAMHGLDLGVRYVGGGRLKVVGYAADRETAQRAVDESLRDVRGVAGVDLDLLTAHDAVRELAEAARAQGLAGRVAISAYPGYVLAAGRLTDDQLAAWTRAKEPVMRRYEGFVDLRENFSGAVRAVRAPRAASRSGLVADSLRRVGLDVGGAPVAAVAAPVAATSGIRSGGAPRGPRLAVQSVSLGAARFMTLKNGKRYFEGGRLPDGYVIREIMADRIVLAKGEAVVTYRIGGD
ncbi:MAG: type III secretion system inner membrane ring subunit SctD [Desulfovibrionaceae bacterium]|jgi:type III secretion system YscD/HrpQ family protein|nr:type III secretion system inner membrane ring subunit SctD [Desulfovibrionaceae bacterium]